MPIIHREGDTRSCGAQTIGSQGKLTFGGKVAALQGDIEAHGGGAFNASSWPITYRGKTLIAVGDTAASDSLTHTNTQAATGFAKVSVS